MVIVVFRSTLRAGVDPLTLAPLGARMYELASAMPGFISYKDFAAGDGEAVSIVEFESLETLAAWRDHPEHVAAQRLGREQLFAAYHIHVCTPLRSYGHRADRSRWRLRTGRSDELARLVAIDDDACSLFVEAGRDGELPAAFTADEQARWQASLDAGRVVVAVTADDEPIGFAALGFVDGEAHLQQLSVRRAWMKLGLGRALVEHALGSRGDALWLTTYADIPWNRPLYERWGFSLVDEASCGPELRAILDAERRALPAPGQRVAMVRRPR
ncbi:MAG: GNAT family N-acetyltransferase [Myxococcota bacterium]